MKNIKSIIFFILTILINPILFLLIFKQLLELNYTLIIYLVIYILSYIILKNYKPLRFLYFPLKYIIIHEKFLLIGGILLLHIILYFGISFILPILLLKINQIFNIINLNINNNLYFILTFGFANIVLINQYVLKYTHKFSPARFRTSKKLKPYKIDLLSEYLFQVDNIRILIFFIYSIILVLTNLNNNYSEFFKPIIQSFVSFIAFDRLYTLIKSSKFNFNILKYKIIKSYLRKQQTLKNK